jgi:phosphoribosylamine--glycine ligase
MADVEKLLVVGGGGREFALIDEALRANVQTVYSTRGEGAVDIGIEEVVNTGLGEKDIRAIGTFASLEQIDLVIVGPEAPLINGIGDVLRARGIPVFGPNADGARFEDDKTVTHDFAIRHGLPNPNNSETYSPDEKEAAKDHIRGLGPNNIFTKRVGQEGGKGAVGYSEDELEKALAEVDAVADKGEDLLIQGRLLGPEYSAMFMLDGTGRAVATSLSRDHKALFDGGLGPNTGGLGAFAPLAAEQASKARRQEIEQIGRDIASGLYEDGIDYRGTIYAGLMAETQDPASLLRMLELNVRFGDPETQVLLPSLGGRAIQYMYDAARGSGEVDMDRLYYTPGDESQVSLTVCLASPGYSLEGAELITGLPIYMPKQLPPDVSIQFAGAKMQDDKPVSSGGRVLYVTKTAPTIEEARTVYDCIGLENNGVAIGNDQQVMRSDIGLV